MKYKTDILISLLLFIFAIIFFVLSSPGASYRDLFTNLSAGFIGSIVTIWGIEFLRRKQFERKTMVARNVAKQDMVYLRNALISYISNPFDIFVDQFVQDGDFSEKSLSKSIKLLLENLTKINLLELLKSLNINQWSHLQINLPLLRFELSEKIRLYRDILPEEVFGKLLVVNKNFNIIYSTFGTFPDLFTKEEKDWPINKGGVEANRNIRLSWLNALSSNLKNYLIEVYNLTTLLEKSNF